MLIEISFVQDLKPYLSHPCQFQYHLVLFRVLHIPKTISFIVFGSIIARFRTHTCKEIPYPEAEEICFRIHRNFIF